MPSPVLNERTLEKAPATWAPPEPSAYQAPISDGPISTWRPQMMTVNGTIGKTAVLFVLLLASATAGWIQTGGPEVTDTGELNYSIPTLAWVGVIVGFGLALLLMFRPHLAKFVAPLYAIAQGFFVGALSRMYETFYDGIVVQAAGATIAVFGVMLVLYRTRIIKVTERFRTIVITRHDRHHGVLRRVLPDPAVRRVRLGQLPLQPESARHRLQRARRRHSRRSTWRSTSTSSSAARRWGSRRTSSGTARSGCSSRSSGSTWRCCGCSPSSANGEVRPPRRSDLSWSCRRRTRRRGRLAVRRARPAAGGRRRCQRRHLRMARHVRLEVPEGRDRVRARLDVGRGHDGRRRRRQRGRHGAARRRLQRRAERAPEPSRVRPRAAAPQGIRDDVRQRRRRGRRPQPPPPGQARDRPRERARVAGPVVRPGLSGAVRGLAGGRCRGRRRGVGDRPARRAPVQDRRVVRVLPQPVRVVGLQPRRPLAAARPRRPVGVEATGGAALRRPSGERLRHRVRSASRWAAISTTSRPTRSIVRAVLGSSAGSMRARSARSRSSSVDSSSR